MSSFRVIKAEPLMRCEWCDKNAETRPYGPQGERICFKCGNKDRKTTEKMMRKYLFGEGE